MGASAAEDELLSTVVVAELSFVAVAAADACGVVAAAAAAAAAAAVGIADVDCWHFPWTKGFGPLAAVVAEKC